MYVHIPDIYVHLIHKISIPNMRHYNPLLIINREFWESEKFLVIQTALHYKPRLIYYLINLKRAPQFYLFFHIINRSAL